jgi:tetratricopeptide (TPR) repeat protein
VFVRLFHLVEFFGNSPFAETLVSDAHIFESWAGRIAEGDWFGEPRLFVLPPLYPYVVGLAYLIIGRNPDFIVFLQSCLGVVSAGLVWRLARGRFGEAAGVSAGILFGASGSVLFYESTLVGTSLAVFLTVLTLTFGDQWSRSGKDSRLAWVGFCFGLLAILRPNFLAVIPFVLASVIWPARNGNLRNLLKPAAAFILSVISVLLLLVIRNGVIVGEWTPLSTHGGINFYMGNHPGAPGWFSPPDGMTADITPDEPEGNLIGPRKLAQAETGQKLSDREVSDFWFYKGLSFIVSEPAEAGRVTFRKMRLFLSAYEVPLNYSYEYHRSYASALSIPFGQLWFLYPLAIIGGLAGLIRRKSCVDLILFLFVYAMSVILFHVSTRYRMPIVPVLAVLGGYTVQCVVDDVLDRRWKLLIRDAFVLGVVVTLFSVERNAWDVSRDRSMDPFNLGTSHLYAARPEIALPYLEEARLAGGRFPSLFYNLGLSYSALGRSADAIRAYETAISADPDMAKAHANLGNILFQSTRYQEAEQAYRKALTADPSAHNARAALGWVHFTFHRDDSARVAWSMVLNQDPAHASALAGMKRMRSLR